MVEEDTKDFIEDFFVHYGAKGMHWGIRKDDKISNPTSGKKVSFREKRAIKKDVLAEKYNVKISEINAKSDTSKLTQLRISNLSKKRDQKLDDAERIRQGKMTSGQKKALIGASVVGVLLLSYGAYKYTDSGTLNQHKIKGKELLMNKRHIWKKNESLSNAKYVDDIFMNVVKPINPGYGKFGTKQNCRRCTFAYEMRRRGFDVGATLSNSGTGQTPAGLLNATDPHSNLPTGKYGVMAKMRIDALKERRGPLQYTMEYSPLGSQPINLRSERPLFTSVIKGVGTIREENTSETIFRGLSSQPNGARGELAVNWSMGGAHSLAWEIIGGKPHIFDTQSGKVYSSTNVFEKIGDNISHAGFTRLDNVDLNNDFLKRWLKDA